MNKSTPLSQLPQTSFNPEQKPSDVLGEDEATIQEVLNQINAQTQSSQQPPIQQPSQPHMQSPPQMQAMMQPPQIQLQLPQYPMPSPSDFYMTQQQAAALSQQPSMPMPSSSLISNGGTMDMFLTLFADDVKLALVVFVSVILAHFIPAASILNKYFAIDKIPYHDLIIRGLLCAILVVLLKKFVVK